MTARLLAVVGTDIHPFPRMVRAVDRWASRHLTDVDCFVQYGHIDPPIYAHGAAFLAHDELEKRLVEADILLCHGGPSTISEGRRRGFRPIVMPRLPELGEHVDDHQQLFVRRLATDGLVRMVQSDHELYEQLDRSLADRSVAQLEAEDRSSTAAAVTRFGTLVESLFQ